MQNTWLMRKRLLIPGSGPISKRPISFDFFRKLDHGYRWKAIISFDISVEAVLMCCYWVLFTW